MRYWAVDVSEDFTIERIYNPWADASGGGLEANPETAIPYWYPRVGTDLVHALHLPAQDEIDAYKRATQWLKENVSAS